MLYFQTWKIVLILTACALGVIFSLPNLFSSATVDAWPSFVPKHQVSLGLDLRGGSQLLLQVDMASVQTERLNGLVDEIRGALLDAKTRLQHYAQEHLTATPVYRETSRGTPQCPAFYSRVSVKGKVLGKGNGPSKKAAQQAAAEAALLSLTPASDEDLRRAVGT